MYKIIGRDISTKKDTIIAKGLSANYAQKELKKLEKTYPINKWQFTIEFYS